jgi:hypothetical protein
MGTVALGGAQHYVANCLAYGNGGYGFSGTASTAKSRFNCAGGSNVSGNRQADWGPVHDMGFIDLTADPFVDAENLDFALNNVAGGGALLRQAGFPNEFPGLNTENFIDINAAQAASVGIRRSRLINAGGL